MGGKKNITNSIKPYYEFENSLVSEVIGSRKGASKELVTEIYEDVPATTVSIHSEESERTPVQTESERIVNEGILKITMTIKDQYPELSKYLEEMPVTIPTEKHPDITIRILQQYYESLQSILKAYQLEHPTGANNEKIISTIDKNRMQSYIVKVKAIEKINHNVLQIVTEKPLHFSFTAGQATGISINKGIWRSKKGPFTMTCIPDDDYLEFTIKIYQEHKGITNELLNLKVEEELVLHSPFGKIGYKGEGTFIAGGTGITPFISIFRDLKAKGEIGNNKLLFANRTAIDIILEEELKEILGNNFISILSNEKAEGYQHGEISKEFIKENSLALNKMFYVCGPPPMMRAMIANLDKLDVSQKLICKEAF